MFSNSPNILIQGGTFESREGEVSTNATQSLTVVVNPLQEVTSVVTTARNSNPTRRVHNIPPAPSYVIYRDQLSSKGRGHPLWCPQPNMRLPSAYRAQGVAIGDVGLITDDGAFDFLFNICLAADHPVNVSVPAGFTPLSPQLHPGDFHELLAYPSGHFLASSSVTRSQSGSLYGDLRFESSASVGAILVMPDDTYKTDLLNLERLINYIGIYAQHWYEFVNGSGGRGRRAQNGDLSIVVGCDKSTSWGIAAISNVSDHATSRLHFRATGEHGRDYTWDYSGSADVRVGPGRDENGGLELQGEGGGGPLRNQCLFLRVVKVKLEESAWATVNQTPGVHTHIESFTRQAPSTDVQNISPKSDSLGASAIQPSRIPRPVTLSKKRSRT